MIILLIEVESVEFETTAELVHWFFYFIFLNVLFFTKVVINIFKMLLFVIIIRQKKKF